MTIMDTPPGPCPDPRALRLLISSGPSEKAVQRLLPDLNVTRVMVERVHFPRAKPVQVQIRAFGNQGQSQTVIGEWVGDAADDLVSAEAICLAKRRRGQKTAAGTAAVVADAARGLVLRRPGFDTRLPGLRLLHDPAWAFVRLGDLGLDPKAKVELVAHRLGKRAVLRITGADGTRYARLRPVTSSSGQAAYDRHMVLWNVLQGVAELTIPRPMGFAADLGVAIFDALPGTPPVFRGLPGFRATHAVLRAIAALQSAPVDAPPHGAADELAILQQWEERRAEVFPELSRRLGPALSRLRHDMAALAPMPPVPCHRDLHEGQILLDERGIGLLDFDTLRMADPALDIGNLQAHLVLASLQDGMARGAFVTAMANAVPHLSLQRIGLWRRAALLRLAMIHAFSATRQDVLHGLINEAG